MARERWFYAPTHKRQGPVALAQLVEGLLRLPDPRACLVWKNGLPAWTPAGDVADVDRHLAPFVVARKPKTAAEGEAEGDFSPGRGEGGEGRVRGRAGPARARKASGPSSLVYAAASGGVVVLAVLVWLFWPKSPPPRPKGTGSGSSAGIITLKEGDPVSAPSAGPAPTGPAPGQAGFAGWSDQETALPSSELVKLRQVAVWSEKTLEVTVYNGSTWRITELFVRPSRLTKDIFVDDEKLLSLVPVGVAVEEGVDQLMNKVAPNRRKAGVNPLDTGKFRAVAGHRPEAFRAPIVGATGYPPK